LQEVTTSLYGSAKEQDATNAKKYALVGCPKIIFIYNELGTTNIV
jgi:hypothetical protein